jgi:TolB-like protein/DNA-binding winged helix-turn-helix (wHTH) protein/Flp pilus assembly protein TadD
MSRPEKHLYEFGPFRLDPAERLLLRGGEPVPLEPKVFDTLVLLIRNSGHLLGKEELMSKVWPDAVVEEGSLTRNISTLRRALGEGEHGLRYIETVPRRGYRFVAGVIDRGDESLDPAKVRQAGAAFSEGGSETHSLDEGGRPFGDDDDNAAAGVGARAAIERTGASAALAGEADTRPASRAEHRVGKFGRRKSVAVVAGIGLVVAVAALAYGYLARRGGAAAINSVVVLPFANVGGDPNLEYLSDGIAEYLINNLSQLPQLKVIARSSAFAYKGKDVDPQEVARALGIGAIVAGRVVQRGDELEISVELMNASDKTQMWGEQYHRRASDLQAVQAEISRAVAEKLRLRLTGAQERQLTRRATDNPQAYQLYLAGLFHARKGNMEGIRKALDYLNQAVVLDPNFALAFASMPAVYSNLADVSGLAPGEAISKGRAAALKALELDGTLAEAHNGLAVIKRQEWDWPGAESEYKRAIELNPNFAAAHSNYALFLGVMGRTQEALAENKRAQELDPLRISFKAVEGSILFGAGLYDEALQVFQNVIRMQPDFAFAHSGLGHAYVSKGMYAEAVSEFKTAVRLYGGASNGLVDLGYAYAASGERDEAVAILNKLKTGKGYVSPAALAVLHAVLGDKEAAFESFERAYAAHDSQLQYIKVDPRCDSLRSDPRFADLLRRVGLAS